MNPDMTEPLKTPEEINEARHRLAATADAELGLNNEPSAPAPSPTSEPALAPAAEPPDARAEIRKQALASVDVGAILQGLGAPVRPEPAPAPAVPPDAPSVEVLSAEPPMSDAKPELPPLDTEPPPAPPVSNARPAVKTPRGRSTPLRVNLGGKEVPRPSVLERVLPSVAKRRAERRARTDAELEARSLQEEAGRTSPNPTTADVRMKKIAHSTSPEIEGASQALSAARGRYINKYADHVHLRTGRIAALRRSIFGNESWEKQVERATAITDLEAAKKEYDAARKSYGQELRRAKERELGDAISPASPAYREESVRLLEEYTGQLYEELIIEEREGLRDLEMDVHPPREKNLFRGLLERWNSVPIPVRLAISASLATGASILTGGVAGVSGAALFFGGRLAWGTLGITGGMAAAESVRGILSKDIERRKSVALGSLRHNFTIDGFDAADKQYEEIFAMVAAAERRKVFISGLAAVATGAGVSMLALYSGGPRAVQEQPRGAGRDRLAPQSAMPLDRPVVAPRPTVPAEPRGQAAAPVEPAPEQPRAAVTETMQDVRPPKDVFASLDEKTVELETVQKGEGIWHAVHRQLLERAKANPADFGLDADDFDSNPAKVKVILDRRVGGIIEKAGLMDTGIARPGVKVILSPDDTINIEGGEKSTYHLPRESVGGVKAGPDPATGEGGTVTESWTERGLDQGRMIDVKPPSVEPHMAPEANPPAGTQMWHGSPDVVEPEQLAPDPEDMFDVDTPPRVRDALERAVRTPRLSLLEQQMRFFSDAIYEKKASAGQILAFLFRKNVEYGGGISALSQNEIYEAVAEFNRLMEHLQGGDESVKAEAMNGLRRFFREYPYFGYGMI